MSYYIQVFVPLIDEGEVVDEMNGPCFGPYAAEEIADDTARFIREHLPEKYDHLDVVVMEIRDYDHMLDLTHEFSPIGAAEWVDSLE